MVDDQSNLGTQKKAHLVHSTMSFSASLGPSISSGSVVSSFFSRLEKVCVNLEDEARTLELRQRRVRRRVDEADLGMAAEAAEAILEEVTRLNKDVADINAKVSEAGISAMETFLDAAVHEYDEMKDKVKSYEAWGAQYGYVPQFNLELNLDDALLPQSPEKEEEEDDDGEKSEEPKNDEKRGTRSTEKKKKKTEEIAPSLLDFGLSKLTLNKIGYVFKEDLQTASSSNVSLVTSTQEPPRPRQSSSGIEASSSSSFSNWEESSSMSVLAASIAEEEDTETPPAPILKIRTTTAAKATTAKVTPTRHGAIEERYAPETSRIEITPGLFVRKPRQQQQQQQQQQRQSVMTVPKNLNMTPTQRKESLVNDGTPQAPDLKTVNLQKLLAESRGQRQQQQGLKSEEEAKTSDKSPIRPQVMNNFATPARSDLENQRPQLRSGKSLRKQQQQQEQDDQPPQMPPLSSKKMRKLLASATKSQQKKSVGRSQSSDDDDPESSEKSPGPPQLPSFSQSTLAMLKERRLV